MLSCVGFTHWLLWLLATHPLFLHFWKLQHIYKIQRLTHVTLTRANVILVQHAPHAWHITRVLLSFCSKITENRNTVSQPSHGRQSRPATRRRRRTASTARPEAAGELRPEEVVHGAAGRAQEQRRRTARPAYSTAAPGSALALRPASSLWQTCAKLVIHPLARRGAVVLTMREGMAPPGLARVSRSMTHDPSALD